ncbi:MAG TPA: ECF transporter S component [Clostridia bacterium]|nr:ECF transporter S component [Clostridia bacterium]
MKVFLFGNAKNKAMVLARIAIMIALTVLAQYLSGLLGNQLLTGSIVNMFLLISALLTGIIGGISVGVVTPFIALALGLNPQVVLVPFIALSNAALVVIFALILRITKVSERKNEFKRIAYLVCSIVLAAGVKFLMMFFFSRVLFPLFFAPQLVDKLSVAWGVLQLFTALIGGAVTIALYYPLKRVKLVPRANSEE